MWDKTIEPMSLSNNDTFKAASESQKTAADIELEQLDKPQPASEEITTLEEFAIVKEEYQVVPETLNDQQIHFEKNCNYLDKFRYFTNVCYCAIATHEFGNAKYEKYSWQNNPEESYATTSVNLNALIRHLILYKTKSPYTSLDESGMSHMAHVAGRCHMLVTNFYREMLFDKEDNQHPTYRDIRPTLNTFRSLLDNNYSTLFCGSSDQLSPEIRMSILKAPMELFRFIEQKDIEDDDKREVLLTTMLEICDSLASDDPSVVNGCSPHVSQLGKVITPIDHLFYCAAAYCHLTPQLLDSARLWMTHKEQTI